MGDVPSRRPSSSPVHGCLVPAVQLVHEQDLAPPSTHETHPQASSPRTRWIFPPWRMAVS